MLESSAWLVIACVHVVPEGDAIDHELSPDCHCLPKEEVTHTIDGTPMYHFSHSALDGRL